MVAAGGSLLSLILMGLLLVWPFGVSALAQGGLREKALEFMAPLEPDRAGPKGPLVREREILGRLLFFDPRVSADGTVSCSRCHLPQLYGTDGLPRSVGVMGRLNPRNAPTVLNSFLQISQHWRGDRESVEDQAVRALVGPPSFGNQTAEAAVARLKAIAGYEELFRRAFPQDPDPVSPRNWGAAIGAFERTLVTPSRLDGWLRGHEEALSPQERKGLERFIGLGCAVCHSGVGVGGGSYEKFGVHADYWMATASAEIDRGRADVTGDPKDLYVFKVPSLRNMEMTSPYFHDGSVPSLARAVEVMAKTQLGQQISQQEVAELVGFLRSLTGTLPEAFLEAPILPPGGFPGMGR